MGKCGACKSEYPDGAYRCVKCLRICNYWSFFASWRWIAPVISLLLLTFGSYWVWYYGFTLPWPTKFRRFESFNIGEQVPIQSVLHHLHLESDSGWSYGSPHIKGQRLHLLHEGFANKQVIVFVHGWQGDYISTWGDIQTILKDIRFNRTYDFVFWGYPSGLLTPAKKLPIIADELNQLLDEMDRRYQAVTTVTHSKGGLVVMRALLNRYDTWPLQPAHRIHKIVMFAPPTVNLALEGLSEKVWSVTHELREMENGTTLSEIDAIVRTIQSILDRQNDSGYRNRFLKTILNLLSVVHGAEDHVVDWVNGEKTVFYPLVKTDSDSEETIRYIVVPKASHLSLVKMGQQQDIPMAYRFENLLWEQVGRLPVDGIGDSE